MAKDDNTWTWIFVGVGAFLLYRHFYAAPAPAPLPTNGGGLVIGPPPPPGGQPGAIISGQRIPQIGDSIMAPWGQAPSFAPPGTVWWTPPVGNPPAAGTLVAYTLYPIGQTPYIDPRNVQGVSPGGGGRFPGEG